MKLKLGKRLRRAKKRWRKAKRQRKNLTLRKRILRAFAFVVVLSVVLSSILAYGSTAFQFESQTEFTSQMLARDISTYLSEHYAATGTWVGVDLMQGISSSPTVATRFVLPEGLMPSFDSGPAPEESAWLPFIGIDEESSSADPPDLPDLPDFEAPPTSAIFATPLWAGLSIEVRTFDGHEIVHEANDTEGIFAYASSFEAPILDLETGNALGHVLVSVTDEYFGLQTTRFFEELLLTNLVGSAVVMAVSLLMGMWLAWRISAPVTALTQASKALADEGSAEHLPITSADELGQMSASFNQLVDKLQTQRKLRKRLISDVSHELNTPLSVIQLEATGIKDGIQAPADAADQIIHEVNMLRNLVYDLNWLGETDVGEVRLNIESHALKAVLGMAVERWQSQARTQQVSLTLQQLPALPPIMVDDLRIGQALGNLLRNALQHTPEGGRVMVSAEKRPIHQAEGDWVVIAVKDTGRGIESAELHHIFERFYRTDEARSRQQGGRGLGLPITRQLVQLHGGHVWAESTVGQGSTFYIALPA